MQRQPIVRFASIAAAAVLLVLMSVSLLYFCGQVHRESSVEYHYRMLRYHGRETKDQTAQYRHAEKLLAQPVKASKLVVDEIESQGYDGRYTPSPYQLLRDLGKPGRKILLERIKSIETEGNGDNPLAMFALLSAAIIVYDDFSLVSKWLALCESNGSINTNDSYVWDTALLVEKKLFEAYGPGCPSVIDRNPTARSIITPEFMQWWRRTQESGEQLKVR